ncbi:apolipoprotein D-like isoform X2 [Hemiscyllium ocellatum]|uniref:apolipoprotein D-like isoform X2 n=1 Tax=Hemiscyllium ocellatum TaxID=170820 RepID=UPI002967359D|nr:apolipoprotein D-like isoform X2 [Hemiscyllium ocellatum]
MWGPFLSLLITSIFLTKRVQAVKWGSCEHVDVQQNFSLDQYMGTWYEIERFYNVTEDLRCISETISSSYNGLRNVYEVITLITKGNEVTERTAELIPPDETAKDQAKLIFRLNEHGVQDPLDHGNVLRYWVLDTDYTSYSLVFSCASFLGIMHTPYAWTFSRERQLSANTTQYLHGVLEKYKINTNDFVKINQEDCT